MATITDPQAIAFVNNIVRPAADKLAQLYYQGVSLSERWTALGGGQPAIDVLATDLKAAADLATGPTGMYGQLWLAEKTWFLLGATSLIPNTADTIADGAGPDGRPIITGAMAVAVMARVTEWLNYVLSSAGSFADTTRANVSYYNTLLAPSSYGPLTLSVADAGNFINRCDEIAANYQAASNANLNSILAVAVNPNP